MDIVERLGVYIAQFRFEDLPPAVVEQAKRFLVDTIGCALGGYPSAPAHIARDMAATVTSTQPARILVSGRSTSPDFATFANGVAVRFLDFNDGYTSTGESGHPSDSIAAALTVAQFMHRSGRDVIAATVLAYEVFCRICEQVNLKAGGFDHTTIGGIASAAAAAKLLGLPQSQIQHALNLHVAANVTLFQTRVGKVSMWKGCAFANASRNAVFAAMLASRGMTGPSPVFEGDGGFFKAVAHNSFTLPVLGGDSHPYKIMECSMKRFPLGFYSQTVVEAALQLRETVGDPANIAEVRVATVSTAVRVMATGAEKWEPDTRETADHSMPYVVAVALYHGPVEEHHFDDRYLHDPAIRSLTRRVKVSVSAEADRRMPVAMLCEMQVVMRSGAVHTAAVEYHRGHYKNPMNDDEINDKFHKLARHVLPVSRAQQLLDRMWRLEDVADINEIVELTFVE